MTDGSHLLGTLTSAVIPEINSVDVAVVKPHRDVMRMICALAGDFLKRKSTRDDRSRVRSEGIKNGFLLRVRITIGIERLSIDRDVQLLFGFVFYDRDVWISA